MINLIQTHSLIQKRFFDELEMSSNDMILTLKQIQAAALASNMHIKYNGENKSIASICDDVLKKYEARVPVIMDRNFVGRKMYIEAIQDDLKNKEQGRITFLLYMYMICLYVKLL